MEPLEENRALQNEVEKIDLTTVSYQGFSLFTWLLPIIKTFQQHFRPHDTDIITATKPKSGIIWLKSSVYSIVHRTRFTYSNHPLLTKNPHDGVLHLEFDIYTPERRKEELDLMMNSMSSPRLFSTHLPYDILPDSIRVQSECKIVYVARNPFDTVVSMWKFLTQIQPGFHEQTSFEDFLENFCRGKDAFGPYWDHVLGYWNMSLKRPDKVIFLNYEDMHEDGVSEMEKLAEFLGYGFSEEEVREGVIQKILKFCSFDNLKNLEVTKAGYTYPNLKNRSFFRKGKVGDWVNHLSPLMAERLDQVMKENFVGSGLEFKMYP